MLKRRTSLCFLLMGWSVSLFVLADPKPGFYQHLDVPNPEKRLGVLLEQGWTIRGYDPLPITPPLDWSADPHGDPNWRYQLNAMYPLAPVFQLLEAEYRSDLHEITRAVFDDWIAFNLKEDADHPFRWNDMAAGVRATYLAQLIHYESLYGGEPFLRRYIDAGVRHLQKLSDPDELADSNHALFQMIGIAALCAVMEEIECDEALPYARSRYGNVFRRQFNEEGMHLEHSPEYHLLALKTFTKIETTGLLALDEADRAILKLAASNLSSLIHPDGTFAAIGDTEPHKSIGAAEFDAEARWLVQGRTAGVRPKSGSWLYPRTGYAFFRELDASGGGSYLFLTTAHHTRNHKHMDTGSFEWSDRGRKILVDSGKWGYGGSESRKYVIGLSAHNTIETRGVDSSPGDLPVDRARLTSFISGKVLGLGADMRLPRRLMDAQFKRTIISSPGEWLVVLDEVKELLPSTHTSWFHLAPQFSLTNVGEGTYDATSADHLARLRVLPLLPVGGSSAHTGAEVPRMLGWYSPAYGRLEANWQIGFEAKGRSVRMATLFNWMDGDEGSSLNSASHTAADRISLCWRENGRLSGVTLNDVNGDMKVGVCE